MNNGQVAALVQNLLMVGGMFAVGSGKISAPDVQTIVGGVSTLIGFFWNHYSAATALTKTA